MQVTIPQTVQSLLHAKVITAADTISLRRQFYSDARIGEVEADCLFALNAECTSKDQTFTTLFVEALTDYIVFQMNPEGYISEANALWLMKQVDLDGKVDTIAELDLLINIIEKARSAPDGLSAYALRQVQHAVINGSGPARSGKMLEAGRVNETDVELLRRILYAYGSGGNVSITAAEAEVLFDINDATADADNHPSWKILFAQAIANYLMMASIHAPVDRETALRQEEWLHEEPRDTVDFLSSMIAGLRSIYSSVDEDDAKQRREAYEARIADSERISRSEAGWLANRINRDGKLSEAERAILTFIKHESPSIHPDLKPLLDQVA
jgi:hypothetical protein